MNSYLIPQWPVAKNIHAYCTTRVGGFSAAPFDSFNLGDHVGDLNEHVMANRNKLINDLELPTTIKWLQQVHSNNIINTAQWQSNCTADGSFSTNPNEVCVIMTADCLPILLCNQAGTQVMALHGGWRGLAADIICKGIDLFHCAKNEIFVWLGPAIGPQVFEVGEDVREIFLNLNPLFSQVFIPSSNGRWLMDIYQTARIQLNELGITKIFGDQYCTLTEKDKFFSYRREGQTGRMASLIYFN